MKNKQILGLIAAALVIVLVGAVGIVTANGLQSRVASSISDIFGVSLSGDEEHTEEPGRPFIAVVDIIGEIGPAYVDSFGRPTSNYVHYRTVNLIYDMMYSDNNCGLFLYMDSPGGTVYHSDEVYLALMEYKEVTGRPIYAYAAGTMASGAYYIACAADEIYANRNSTLGSIGVYIHTVNYAGLYESLGIEGEYIKSGENKAMGNAYAPLTEEQRAIYQGIVDECYDQFVEIVCDSRGYTTAQALPIADGRIYTAKQSVDNGLIDGISLYEDYLYQMMDDTGVSYLYFREYSYSDLLSLLGMLSESLPKSDSESTYDFIESLESGVPMYHAG